jgi:hypothetical protein
MQTTDRGVINADLAGVVPADAVAAADQRLPDRGSTGTIDQQ